jgi:hypothetical protein
MLEKSSLPSPNGTDSPTLINPSTHRLTDSSIHPLTNQRATQFLRVAGPSTKLVILAGLVRMMIPQR